MTRRILLVEDNPHNMRLVRQLMDDVADEIGEDIELFCADNGKTALELAKDVPLHLILMDIALPDMNGIEVTRKLKHYPHLKETPFIVVTAYAMAQEEQLFRETFDDYLSKPIDDDVFISNISQWLRNFPSQPLHP